MNAPDRANPLHGKRIASLETREAERFSALLRDQGAEVVECPAVAIVGPADPQAVAAWLERFAAKPFDDLILLTGEGLYWLHELSRGQGREAEFLAALARTRTVCRGPKPVRMLRSFGLPPRLRAAEPTTGGVIALLSGLDLKGRRVGVQLYPAAPDNRLVDFLLAAGALADPVTPYDYGSEAADAAMAVLIEQIACGSIDAVVFTSASQVRRLFAVAEAYGLAARLAGGLQRIAIAAMGPAVCETLARYSLAAEIVPRGSYFMKPLVSAIVAAMAGGRRP